MTFLFSHLIISLLLFSASATLGARGSSALVGIMGAREDARRQEWEGPRVLTWPHYPYERGRTPGIQGTHLHDWSILCQLHSFFYNWLYVSFSNEGSSLETLELVFRQCSNFLYFDLYFYIAYAAHDFYCTTWHCMTPDNKPRRASPTNTIILKINYTL